MNFLNNDNIKFNLVVFLTRLNFILQKTQIFYIAFKLKCKCFLLLKKNLNFIL